MCNIFFFRYASFFSIVRRKIKREICWGAIVRNLRKEKRLAGVRLSIYLLSGKDRLFRRPRQIPRKFGTLGFGGKRLESRNRGDRDDGTTRVIISDLSHADVILSKLAPFYRCAPPSHHVDEFSARIERTKVPENRRDAPSNRLRFDSRGQKSKEKYV